MFIRSERLFLRPAWPEDWSEILQRIASERVVRNLARAPWPYRAEHAREFAALAQDARLPHFMVTLPGPRGAELIGGVGLHAGETGAELGYWIAPEHWGRGFATEAARALLGLARTLGHREVHAHHFLDNPASGRVLDKAGFRRTGKVSPRTGLARREPALAATYVAEIAPAGNSGPDDGAGGDGGPAMMPRRAA